MIFCKHTNNTTTDFLSYYVFIFFTNIELELERSKRDNPYYSVEDEFGEDDGELDRILQEDYE